MAKRVQIPATLDLQFKNAQRIGASLKKVMEEAQGVVSSGLQSNVEGIYQNIQEIIKVFGKHAASGLIDPADAKKLEEVVIRLSRQAGLAAADIQEEFNNISMSQWSEEAIADFNKLDTEIEELKLKLESLREKAKAPKRTDALLSEEDRSSLKISKYSSDPNKAIAKLREQNKEFNKLTKKSTELTAEEQKRLEFLRPTDELRQKSLKALESEVRTQKAQAKKQEDTKTVLEEKVKLQEKITREEKKRLTGTAPNELGNITSSVDQVMQTRNTKKLGETIQEISKDFDIFSGITKGATTQFANFARGIATGTLIFSNLRKVYRQTIETIKELDKSFNEIAMVTTMTTKEAWELKDAFTEIASATGQTISAIAELSVQFFRQGRSISETIRLTEAAAMAARIAGISVTDSVNYLTSAINGFQMSASQAMEVSDKFAALAASSASSYEELAIALSKVAAQAYAGGVEMDNLMAFLAKGIETTREAPENIGTAFKTVFARMSEIKDLGATLEDGMSVGRVDAALKSVGVQLTDTRNELRNLDEVLIELGHNWVNMSKNQKAYVATALAGTRQQTRLLAVMESFDRTMELVDISTNSLGASLSQQQKYANSMAYAFNNLTVAWQEFISNLGSSDAFILFYKLGTQIINMFNQLNKAFGSWGSLLTVISGIMILAVIRNYAYISSQYKSAVATAVATAATKEEAQTRIANIALIFKEIAAKKLLAGANAKLSGGLLALKAAMGGPMLAFVAFVGVVALVVNEFTRADRENKKFLEGLKQTQAEMFNTRKKAGDLETLVARYEELNKIVNKTNKDLQEQNEILQQMQDIVGDKFMVQDITGRLNIGLVKAEIHSLYEEADELMQESIDKALAGYETIANAFKVAVEGNDMAAQQHLIIAQAMEDTNASYQEFLKLSKDAQDVALLNAEIALKHQRIIEKTEGFMLKNRETGKNMYEDLEFFVDEDAAKKYAEKHGLSDIRIVATVEEVDITDGIIKEAQDYVADLYGKGFEDASFIQQTEMLENFNQLTKASQSTIASLIPGVAGVNSAMEILSTTYGDMGSLGIETIQGIVQTAQISSDQIISIADYLSRTEVIPNELKGSFFKNSIENGVTAALEDLQTAFEATGKTAFEFYDVLQQVSDLAGSSTFEELAGSATNLNSIYDNIAKINEMMTGAADYDLAVVNQMLELYPELYTMIEDGQEITAEGIAQIAESRKESFKQELLNKKAELELQMQLNNERIMAITQMLQVADELHEIALDNELDLTRLTTEDIGFLYEEMHKKVSENKIKSNKEALVKILEDERKSLDLATEEGQLRYNNIARQITAINSSGSKINVGNVFSSSEDSGTTNNLQAALQGRLDGYLESNRLLAGQIKNIDMMINRLDKVGNLKKIEKDTKGASKAAKEYEAQIDALYIALQQLAAVDSMISQFQQMQEYAKSGEEFVVGIWAMNEALEIRNEVLKDVIKIQKQEQASLINSLGSLNKYTKVVNGKLQVSLKDYIKLTDEQKELIDDVVKEYDSLTDSINDNSLSINENTAQIEKNNKILRDTTLKLQEDIRKAIENEEKKKLDIIKKSIAAEKKLLDERKKLYQDSFEEEDYHNELNEIDEERQKVISELAGLEGATGAQANRRRQELLSQKAELDKNYNEKVRDYNRSAVLESIDLEQEALDEKQQAAEEAFNNFVNDTDAMQARINQIIEGSADSILDYLTTHSDTYANALELDRQNMETEWGRMIGIVKTALVNIDEGIPEEYTLKYNIPDFVSILRDINNLADGLSKIPSSITTTHTINTVNTSSGSTSSTGGAAADKVTTGYVWGPWTKVSATQERRQQFKVTYTNGKETKREVFKTEFRQTASNVQQSVTTSDRYSGVTYQKFDKGGIADFTGPAWLDGTKRRPERILSPIQTQLFEQMVASLEEQKRLGMTTNNSEVSIGPISVSLASGTKEQAQEAGRLLADEVKKAMKTRGIVVNTKVSKY